ncbi:12098_t:CDS:1, partial [Cetraspora pellucida]
FLKRNNKKHILPDSHGATMESSFVSRETFNEIITEYITNLPKCKQDKALINLELLSKIKLILLNLSDMNISDKNTREWARKRFQIEEITPDDFRIIVKKDNNP